MEPACRKESILDAALKAANKHGFAAMRQKDIAVMAKCGYGTVTLYFNTMTQMRRAVMRAAIKREDLAVIAQGIACGDPDAKKATPELKAKAIASLSN